MKIDIHRIGLYLAGKLPPYYRAPFDKLELIELIREKSPDGFTDDFFKIIDSQDFYSMSLARVQRAEKQNKKLDNDNQSTLLEIIKALNIPKDAGGLGDEVLISEGLLDLKEEYEEMKIMTDARARGYRFEKWLEKLFNLFGLDARGSYKSALDQIDFSFDLDGRTYLGEAKWTEEESDTGVVDRVFARLDRYLVGTIGLAISQCGFKENAIDAAGRHKNILLMDGNNLEKVLDGTISLTELLRKIRRRMTEFGIPNVEV